MRRSILMLSAGACVLAAWRPSPPRLLWNPTASVSIGLYAVARPGVGAPRIGDLVVVVPPPETAAWLARAGWLPSGVPLLKPVAARSGQEVCRRGAVVTIDGRLVARARLRDAAGRLLPSWQGCRRLGEAEVFVLAAPAGSFDGRYLGPTQRSRITGIARPLWTRPEPGSRAAP